MNNLMSELVRTNLISTKKATAINRIKDRNRVIHNQLNHLYRKPVENSYKIEHLESLKLILGSALISR